jgi:ABC-type antimicrobial peptide transport system permease subunit
LRPHHKFPLNAYVSLANLQRALEQNQKVNALLVSRPNASVADSLELLQQILRENIQLSDLGVLLRPYENFVAIESSEIILSPIISHAVNEVSAELNASTQSLLTYLANTIELKGRLLPYSTISATTIPVVNSFGELSLTTGLLATALADDEILLNEWAARDLEANVGDTIKFTYYAVSGREQLLTQSRNFRLAGITAMTGLGVDSTLTPQFPGIHEAKNMQSWEPPFPVDLNLIRPQDEAYWDQYRSTPKAFISLTTGQRLWSSRFGNLTSIRVGTTATNNGEGFSAKLRAGLLAKIKPEQMELVFQPIKQQGLMAAEGATDFGILFIGFSWFLIVSAALLVGMLFRLGVEQRAKEIGILLAVGYPTREVRRQLLKEGSLLVGIGGLLGLVGAIAYAAILMFGLRTWWIDAIGASSLFLHVNAASLIIGYIAAIIVTLFSIVWTLRQLGKIPAPALLHGVTSSEQMARPRFSKSVALIAFGLTGVTMVLANFSGEASAAGWFFGSGTCLLIAGLAMLSLWFRQIRQGKQHDFVFFRIAGMAIRYCGRNPGRSMLCAALVASACFVIVAVAANRRETGQQALARNSGAGGFTLVAKSDIPLHYDLNTKAGRGELGFDEAADEIFNAVKIFSLRLLPGDDASCLNLYQPQKPRVLGVASDQIARGGFEFRELSEAAFNEEPWRLLEKEMAPDIIPAFGDYNSVKWILHLGLNKDLVRRDDWGREIKLRFVGLLERSIFQSEVLISEGNFLKHFPGATGYSYFLVATPIDQTEAVANMLEKNLRDYGFDVSSTASILDNFQAVENTYLSVFQTLGGLGLLLGTFGLGIILIRNVIERRGELAVLRAIGFRNATLTLMLLFENGFLILAGIVIGSVAALVAVSPHLASGSAQAPWLSIGINLLAVIFVGLLASSLSVFAATRIALLPVLKAE